MPSCDLVEEDIIEQSNLKKTYGTSDDTDTPDPLVLLDWIIDQPLDNSSVLIAV